MSSRCEEMKISVTHRRVCDGSMCMECFSEYMTKIYGDGVCLCLFLCVFWHVWEKIRKGMWKCDSVRGARLLASYEGVYVWGVSLFCIKIRLRAVCVMCVMCVKVCYVCV